MTYPSELFLWRCLEIADFDLACPLETLMARYPSGGAEFAFLLSSLVNPELKWKHPLPPSILRGRTLGEVARPMLEFAFAQVNDGDIGWFFPWTGADRKPPAENLRLREILAAETAHDPEALCRWVRLLYRDHLPVDALRRCFRFPHVVLPVIHVESEAQAWRNALLAREAGADGVFLINHSMSGDELLQIQVRVSKALPDWWIGVNCLDRGPEEMFHSISDKIPGVWVDNAMIQEQQRGQPAAQAVREAQRRRGWQGLYFGGVAFKYQRTVEDLSRAASTARDFMSVVTTSGPGTGRAAHVEKIRTMKAALGDYPLAIASGITPQNIHEYLPHSDCYLVATGISQSFEELDPELTRQLVRIVRAYDSEHPKG